MALVLGPLLIAGATLAIAESKGPGPLVVPGKTKVYQRVLTRPGAKLLAEANSAGKVLRNTIPPLSVFYVFERKQDGGKEWLRIGGGSEGAPAGWIDAATTVEWRHAITLAFEKRANREPVLFFVDDEPLEKLLQSNDDDRKREAGRLRAAATSRVTGTSIVAIEPEVPIEMTKKFYLLPVTSARQIDMGTFQPWLLKIAAVPADADAPPVPKLDPSSSEEFQAMRAGVVFVIDTTKSMGPYIEQAREAVRRILLLLKESKWRGSLSFGLVGYRASLSAAPGIEYDSRVFVDLPEGADGERFLERVNGVREATVSTGQFNEEPLLGLNTAIDSINWKGYSARFIFLITDAGARDLPGIDTQASLAAVASHAADRGIAIGVLHLATPEGKSTHGGATAQYGILSRFPNTSGALYRKVPDGRVDAFRTELEAWARSALEQLGRGAEKALASEAMPAPTPAAAVDKIFDEIGHAMRLAYLGAREEVVAPDLVEGWAANVDLVEPRSKAFDVRVLLTKRQLSDLAKAVRAIMDAAERRSQRPDEFIEDIRKAAVAMTVDPKQGPASIKDTRILGEVVDDLPFKSRIAELSQEKWDRMSYAQHAQVISGLKAKLRYYDTIDRDPDLWVSLDQSADRSEDVYPVPIDMLP